MSMTKNELQQFLIDNGLHINDNDGDIIVVDPVDIAKRNNIEVIVTDLSGIYTDKEVCGFIQRVGGSFQIFIEKSHHPNRQRFTLAHELGHYFLHMQDLQDNIFIDIKDTILFRDGKYDKKEMEANEFAAEYLMPELMVKKLYKKIGITEILAKYFGVSRMAMAFRIDNIFKDE